MRPRVTVSRPPRDFGPAQSDDTEPIISDPTSIVPPKVVTPPKVSEALDAVKDAVDSVVGAIGKALSPGASKAPNAAN